MIECIETVQAHGLRVRRAPPSVGGVLLVAAVLVEDHVDDLAGRDSGLDRVEEAQELLMPVALHPHDPTCSRSVLEPGMGGSGAPAPDQGNAPSPDSWAPLTLSLGPKPQLSAIFCPGGALQRTLWDGMGRQDGLPVVGRPRRRPGGRSSLRSPAFSYWTRAGRSRAG